MFQSTRPRGTRLTCSAWPSTWLCFQSPPRADASRPCSYSTRDSGVHRPRAPRGTRLKIYRKAREYWLVSIHAPRAGRIPLVRRRPPAGRRVSIRAPARDATTMGMVRSRTLKMFQSTRPARGAITRDAPRNARCAGFNPRAPRGTTEVDRPVVVEIGFNPRAPRGTRHVPIPRSSTNCCFNPRAPRGTRPWSSGRRHLT